MRHDEVLFPVLLLVTVLIVYGSLYPWQFHETQLTHGPLITLLHSWPAALDRFTAVDMFINVALYLPFGAACYLWLAKRAAWLRVGTPLVLAAALSGSIEMIQLFDAKRTCSLLDLLTNVAGSALGVLAGSRLRFNVAVRRDAAGPLLLVSCWMGALLFPVMPDLSRAHLRYKLAHFASPPFAVVPLLATLALWLAAARLLQAASSRRLFPWLLLALPARLFVSGATLAWTDCLPAAAAYAIWYAWLSRAGRRNEVLAGLSILAIVLTGLAPFHFAAPQRFSWMPYRALFSTDWEQGFAIFFRKCFAYGAAIWLLAASGVSMLTSTALIAFLLAGLEAIQIYLPGHVAESTDPLQAIILAFVLVRLPRNERPKKRVC